MRVMCCLLLLSTLAIAQSPAPGDIAISEILPNPAVVADDNGEYFEICNLATQPLELQGCTFVDTNSPTGVTIAVSIMVAPGEFVTFIRDAGQAAAWGIPGQVYGYTTVGVGSCTLGTGCVGGSAMNFGNSGDGVLFKAPDGTVLDSASYTGSAPSGVSYERRDLRSPWSAPGNVTAGVAPIDGSNYGTPGAPNTGDLTPGQIRRLHAAPDWVLATGAVPDIAAFLGTTLDLHILSPAHGGKLRVLAASAATAPGIPWTGGVIGIAYDDIFTLSTTPGSPWFIDFGTGSLGGFGQDAAAVVVPDLPALTGLNLYAAYVVVDGSSAIVDVSDVATLTFTEPAPLSSLVALSIDPAATMALGIPGVTASTHIADYVKALVHTAAASPTTLAGIEFPLAPASSSSIRAIPGLTKSLVARWFDPLTTASGTNDPRFGANCDYVAWFGEGWNTVPGSAPQFSGSGDAGWIWVNHEYVSGNVPTLTSPPTNQARTLALWLRDRGLILGDPLAPVWSQADVDAFQVRHKKELGGSWFRITKGSGGAWSIDPTAPAVRYDGTSSTLTMITGYTPHAIDHDDSGAPLPPGVASGILGDCSGAQTPWGTVITAEENVQDYYGDLEPCWTSQQRFVAGVGFDPGANIAITYAPSAGSDFGMISDPNQRHERDLYGFLVEIDPGATPNDSYESVAASGDGLGHRKIGAMGRARWENATIVTGTDFRLVDGKPIVIYAGDDRRSGRVYKFVSSAVYTAGMTRGQIRALLDSGDLYVAHLQNLDHAKGDLLLGGVVPTEAAPGTGTWYRLSTGNLAQVAPNAAALGDPTKTVGAALQDVSWNSIGGFPDDNTVKACMFTACNKLGITELNRPEDLEWNPFGTPRLFLIFTNHGRKVANDQSGVLYPPATHSSLSPTRPDAVGSIFVFEESTPADPGSSLTFTWYRVWKGASASQNSGLVDPYRAANPDNMMIDDQGGVWFGTDGNVGTNGRDDAVYYLDLDPAHQAGAAGVVSPTYGLAFRVAAAASDAEATGPCFTSDLKSLFFNIQHPGEGVPSRWPNGGF